MKYGKYVRRFSSSYCVLDLETTGLSAENSEIIEIGIIKVRDGQEVDVFQTLVRPKTLPIPYFIENLTGISTRMVKNAPAFEEVAADLLAFIGEDDIVGYNTSFDLRFLAEHLKKDLMFEYIDVKQFARKVYPHLPGHSLSDLTDHLNIRSNAHRALADCQATMDVYEQIKAICASRNQEPDDLFKSSARAGRRNR